MAAISNQVREATVRLTEREQLSALITYAEKQQGVCDIRGLTAAEAWDMVHGTEYAPKIRFDPVDQRVTTFEAIAVTVAT